MILSLVAYVIFASLMVAAAVTDVRTLRIPNKLCLLMVGLWVAWRVCLGIGSALVGTDFVTGVIAPEPLTGLSAANGIIGAVALGGALLLVTTVFEALAKKRAMGGGDIKLLAVTGLFLGLERGIACLLIACVASVAVAIVLPRTRWGQKGLASVESGYPIMRDLPFGPSIAIGSVVALCFM